MNWYELTIAELERRSVFDATFFSDQREMVAEIIVREKLDWRAAADVRWCLWQHWQETHKAE